jgi:UDP-N-acetylmuramoyl-L-alanyl-D-glutamate--2,6-diaminopimelate ligase
MPMGFSSTPEIESKSRQYRKGERQHTVAGQQQSGSVTLRALLEGVQVRSGLPAVELRIRQVANDSRRVQAGALFVAIHGEATDGNLYTKEAVARGAVAVMSENPAPADWPREIPWVQVHEGRKALAIAAANYYGQPAKVLTLVGVTGTNGKTTTTSLIDSILRASGARTGLFGTIAYRTPRGEHPAPNTTPSPAAWRHRRTRCCW